MVKKIPAIIPARGGSKGLPGKNIKNLAGKPLIAWTIEAALKSKYISDVIVTTDSEEIAEISEQYGASVPFLRPAELSSDDSIAIDVYLYTIERLNIESDEVIEEFIVLQPTSPLRTTKHIDEAYRLFIERNADSVLSFYENPHPTNWLKIIDKNGLLKNYVEKTQLKNRQDFPKTYLPNGAILVLKYGLLKKFKTYYFPNSFPYIMDRELSIDIDDEFDFNICEMILSRIA